MAEHLGDLSSNLETRSQQTEPTSLMKIGRALPGAVVARSTEQRGNPEVLNTPVTVMSAEP